MLYCSYELKKSFSFIYSERSHPTVADNVFDESTYEVEFLNCVADRGSDFVIVDSDSHFSDFVGVHISKIRQRKLFLKDIIVPADRDMFFKRLCKKDSKYIYIDLNIINKDGAPVLIHCTAQNIGDSKLSRLVFADVSKSREKTRALAEKANEVNHLIDLVTGGVCLFKVTPEMNFEIQYINEACCRLFGTTKENYDWRAYDINELFHPEDKTVVYQAIGRALATGEDIDLEFRAVTHKDQYIWCKCNAAVQRYDDDGSPVFHAVFTDITRIKQAERRADEANDKLINLLENLSGAVFFAGLDAPFVAEYASADFLRLTGYSRRAFENGLKNDLGRLIGGGAEDLAAEIKKQTAKGGKSEVCYEIKSKEGNPVLVRDRRKLVTQSDGTNTLICELEEVSE